MTIQCIKQTVPVKHDLEDHIDMLRELDELRKKSGEWRDKGLKALADWPENAENTDENPLINAIAARAFADATLYRYSKIPTKEKEDDLSKKLKKSVNKLPYLSPKDLGDPTKHPYSLIDAAYNLKVLSAAPGFAFSEKALYCFYWIVREFYTASVPDWRIGGAGATPGGTVSAYMTSCCFHALLDFADAQENAAKFVKTIREFVECLAVLEEMPNEPLQEWKKMEKQRLSYSYYLKLQRYSKSLAIGFEIPGGPKNMIDIWEADSYVKKFMEELISKITDVQNAFESVIKSVESFRICEETSDPKTSTRTALGHAIALSALKDGKNVPTIFLKTSRVFRKRLKL